METRKWKTNEELDAIAQKYSQQLYTGTVPDFDEGENVNVEDWRRTTETEKEILYDIFYTALLTLNFYHSAHGDRQRGLDDGVVNMAEFCTITRLPNANSYITTYCPLRKVLRNWETEEK